MADFIAADRSEMMVVATNSFLFPVVPIYTRINYLQAQNSCIR